MRIRSTAAGLILLFAIVTPFNAAMPQETITAVCRQPNSFNIVPIAIDVPTGNGTVLLPAVIAADAEGHVSATLDAYGKLIAGFSARQSANGPFAETLLTIDTATGSVQSATGPLFTDAVLGSTVRAKAVHITELRTAINALRAAAGLSSTTFTDPALTPQSTRIKAVHIAELRSALDAALSTLALFTMSYTDPILTPGATPLKAAHLMELRSGVQ